MLKVKETYRVMPCYTLLDGVLIGIGGPSYKPSLTGRLEIPEATQEQYQKCYDRGQTAFFEEEAVAQSIVSDDVVIVEEESVSDDVDSVVEEIEEPKSRKRKSRSK